MDCKLEYPATGSGKKPCDVISSINPCLFACLYLATTIFFTLASPSIFALTPTPEEIEQLQKISLVEQKQITQSIGIDLSRAVFAKQVILVAVQAARHDELRNQTQN